jgi:sugar/nucleoside kinase (ribokinase family)
MRSPPLVAASVAWGLGWVDAVRWGASAGTLSVTRRGLATPDRREIHQLLDRIDVVPLR